jgi:hypothetical protein
VKGYAEPRLLVTCVRMRPGSKDDGFIEAMCMYRTESDHIEHMSTVILGLNRGFDTEAPLECLSLSSVRERHLFGSRISERLRQHLLGLDCLVH